MKIKEGFVLRQIGDEMVVVGEGLEQVNFNKIICLNDTATYLWKTCKDKNFDLDMLADLLVEKYEVDRNLALNDARVLTDKWAASGMMEK
jgi:hypothetical protein